jgi:hypothetical protein
MPPVYHRVTIDYSTRGNRLKSQIWATLQFDQVGIESCKRIKEIAHCLAPLPLSSESESEVLKGNMFALLLDDVDEFLLLLHVLQVALLVIILDVD